MENKLERRYGLFTAICMVVGIVIGSARPRPFFRKPKATCRWASSHGSSAASS